MVGALEQRQWWQSAGAMADAECCPGIKPAFGKKNFVIRSDRLFRSTGRLDHVVKAEAIAERCSERSVVPFIPGDSHNAVLVCFHQQCAGDLCFRPRHFPSVVFPLLPTQPACAGS